MSEIDNLLNELRNMKSETNKVANTKETWSKIQKGDWQGLGFASEQEMMDWIDNNPYSNL